MTRSNDLESANSSSSGEYTPAGYVLGNEVPLEAVNRAHLTSSDEYTPSEPVLGNDAPPEVVEAVMEDVTPPIATVDPIQEPRPLSPLPPSEDGPTHVGETLGMSLGKLLIMVQCLAVDSLDTPRPFIKRPDGIHLITAGNSSPDDLYAKVSPHFALCQEYTDRVTWDALKRDGEHSLARLDATYQTMQGTLSMLNELVPELYRRSRLTSQTQLEEIREGPTANDEQKIRLREKRSYWDKRTHETLKFSESAMDSFMSATSDFFDIIEETSSFTDRVSADCDSAESQFDHIRAVLGVGELPEDLDSDGSSI